MSFNWMDFVVSPLSGAVIGYFTNWLAIKMLFRPHEEKRIGGRKLPFTPGLIPKERLRLAQKLGETTGNKILTADTLLDSVLSDEIMSKLKDTLMDFLYHGGGDGKTLGDYAAMFSSKAELEENRLAEIILYGWDRLAQSPAVRETAVDAVYTAVTDYLARESASGLLEKFSLSQNGWEKAGNYLRSPEFAALAKEKTISGFQTLLDSENTLGQVLPHYLTGAVRDAVTKQLPRLSEMLEGLLENSPRLDETLRELTAKVARENFGALVGLFVNYHKLYDNIKKNIIEYLRDENNQRVMEEKLEDFCQQVLEKRIGELAAKLGPVEKLGDGAADMAVKILSAPELLGASWEFLAGKLGDSSLLDSAKAISPHFEEKLKEAIGSIVSACVEGMRKNAGPTAEKISQYLSSLTLSPILAAIPGDKKEAVADRLLAGFKVLIKQIGPGLFEAMNISGIVEDKINAFSVEEAEEIIISVANRELKMITYLGGVLGLAIGFTPAIISLFS